MGRMQREPTIDRTCFWLETDRGAIALPAESATIGRSPDCDWVIASTHASRVHCRIDCNRGKFILTDNSSNGTYVTRSDVELYFHQEQVPLLGEGLISLGTMAANSPEFVIRYAVKSKRSKE